MKLPIILSGLLALVGCSEANEAPGPGGVTVGEARALDEAAQMIDARRVPLELGGSVSTQELTDDATGATAADRP